MQNIARSARSRRRHMARLLCNEPDVPPLGAPGAREIVLDHPFEHDGIAYRTLTIRTPGIVDYAKVESYAKGKLSRGFALVSLCCGVSTEVLVHLDPVDQEKIGEFMSKHMSK